MTANYPIRLTRKTEPDRETYWFVEIPDLPGCVSHGSTPEEALESIQQAKDLWIATRKEQGHRIPDPTPEEFSGHLHLRLPRALHYRLAVQSQQQGVSLNLYMIHLLSTGSASADPGQLPGPVPEEVVAERRGRYRVGRRTRPPS